MKHGTRHASREDTIKENLSQLLLLDVIYLIILRMYIPIKFSNPIHSDTRLSSSWDHETDESWGQFLMYTLMISLNLFKKKCKRLFYNMAGAKRNGAITFCSYQLGQNLLSSKYERDSKIFLSS